MAITSGNAKRWQIQHNTLLILNFSIYITEMGKSRDRSKLPTARRWEKGELEDIGNPFYDDSKYLRG